MITGCGGNETTCSRMSISGRTRSMNGTRMFRPGMSVLWYRPRRSTTPALACGMMRIERTMHHEHEDERSTSGDHDDQPMTVGIEALGGHAVGSSSSGRDDGGGAVDAAHDDAIAVAAARAAAVLGEARGPGVAVGELDLPGRRRRRSTARGR